MTRRRDQRRDSRQELERRHDSVLGFSFVRVFRSVRNLSVTELAESSERQRRTRAVAAQALAAHVVLGGDANACVQVEA
jgi:hypothetical protein